MRAAVVGGSGYAGSEILRLIAHHPHLDMVLGTSDSAAGRYVGEYVPSLAGVYGNVSFSPHASVHESDADIVFLALPHGVSQEYVPSLVEQGRMVVDLGADYRLRNPAHYETWYHAEHRSPELLARSVYGLVERHRTELLGARLIAVPGCYPTASALALGPFLDAGWVESDGVVINALSGVSGAGRVPTDRLHFPRLSGNAEAYGLLDHRHTIEIQEEIGAEVLFTPHLVPASRGMLVTAYARVRGERSTEGALALLRKVYENDPCVVVTNDAPAFKDPLGSNLCFVSARVDPRTGWLVSMCALDNLTKGAAGQAVQAVNVALGWDETLGLPLMGVAP